MESFNYVSLSHELDEITSDIKRLRSRKKQIIGIFKQHNKQPINNQEYFLKPLWLYVLKLENDKYYVGMTRCVESRFKRHMSNKGAKWTKLHKPVEIIYSENTGLNNESEVALLEDDLTISTAENYGYDNVRGGQWCYINRNPFRNNHDDWTKII